MPILHDPAQAAPVAGQALAEQAVAGQAQRLLEAMRPVCSHDLPNQVVALQSLLQLFLWDEAAQLSPQGREYFERLQSIAGKTMALAQHLKELARLQRYQPRGECLTFASVVDDLRAEMQRSDPDCRWTWQSRWRQETFRADRHLVQQALLQLLRGARAALAAPALIVDMATAGTAGEHIEWTIAALPGEGPAPAQAPAQAAAPASERRGGDMNEQRLAWTLAQEYLAAAGIVCRADAAPAPGAAAFTLIIPNRSPHG